jgi:peptide/nickel transport system substrate-binding protein
MVEWAARSRVVLDRNEEWWGERKPYLDRVVLRFLNETEALGFAAHGEIDVVSNLVGATWQTLDDSPLRRTYHRTVQYDNNYAWIGWNTERPLFSDRAVRRALTMLVDREGLIRDVQGGLGRPTDCHFYAPSAECRIGVEQPRFDPAAAVRLLDAAGWRDTDGDGIRDRSGEVFSFRFMIPASSSEARAYFRNIAASFRGAGIDARIDSVPWPEFVERLRHHDFDACTLMWGNTSPRTDPAQIWHSSAIAGGSNYVLFRHPRADALIDSARTTMDPQRRVELFRELGRILIEEQPYTFLWTRPRLTLYHQRVRGIREGLSWHQFDDWWVEPTR